MHSKKLLISVVVLALVCLFAHYPCFSQVEEDKESRQPQRQMLRKAKPYKFSSSASVFGGYDTNVKLVPQGKGSAFQEFLYSLYFDKPLSGGFRLKLYYDLDYLNYSEITDSSNLMNHLRLDLSKKLDRKFSVGTGYDFSDFYYPKNEDGDFLFHKGFVYLRHDISRSLFHRVLFEYGYKAHVHKKALADSITELSDKESSDRRQVVEYTVGWLASRDLYLNLRTRFSINNANARYMDFYDYNSYEISPALNYRLCPKAILSAYFSYLRREYKSRLLSTGGQKTQKDNVWAPNVGIRYNINKQVSTSLFYTYRNNCTNEPLEKYKESVFTWGLEYSF